MSDSDSDIGVNDLDYDIHSDHLRFLKIVTCEYALFGR